MSRADTIFALSSGAPPSAIAIIRISGTLAFKAAEQLCGDLPKHRRAALRKVKDIKGLILDEALILTFPGPNSATGEDLAELHLHGGRAVVRAVEAELANMKGLRLAIAGEFTRRSFENGRMDLNQADGLSDLLFAETEKQRKAAISMMGGAFGHKIAQWQKDILHISALIESELDFSDEDDVDTGNRNILVQMVSALKDDIESLLCAPPIERLRDGIKIVLGGPPNSGKSTLLNALVGRDAAIVSDIAGTTRDVIEIPIAINGLAFVFLDTAGVRYDSDDIIEKIGIEKAQSAFAMSDIILWLGSDEGALKMLPKMSENQKLLKLCAKSDIGYIDKKRISISAKTGDGMDMLKEQLVIMAQDMIPAEDSFAINARQKSALSDMEVSLSAIIENEDWLIMGEHARLARLAIDRLTGRAHTEELLDTLFSRFCIGK